MSREESRGRREAGSQQQAEDERPVPESAEEVEANRWDADDPRRRDDCFAPPQVPCECWCMHCRRTFNSDGIWFQRVLNDPNGFSGFWMCPTPNCDGAGFTFDIFPTDPAHPANEGWHYDDDGEGDEGEELGEGFDELDGPDADAEWDPDESAYKALDEVFGGDDDEEDLEGEEWKLGLQPGERPQQPDWVEQARLEREEEERRYDQPDERPRVLDWSDREDRRSPDGPVNADDDIPF